MSIKMERDVKKAKGADDQPIATLKETPTRLSLDELEAELRDKSDLVTKLMKENEDLQSKLRTFTKGTQKKAAQSRYWRLEEHTRFLEALEKFGQRDVKSISAYVGTRSPTQVRTHAQKFFLKQRREESAQLKSASNARKRKAYTEPSDNEEEEEEEEDDDDLMEEGVETLGHELGASFTNSDGKDDANGTPANRRIAKLPKNWSPNSSGSHIVVNPATSRTTRSSSASSNPTQTAANGRTRSSTKQPALPSHSSTSPPANTYSPTPSGLPTRSPVSSTPNLMPTSGGWNNAHNPGIPGAYAIQRNALDHVAYSSEDMTTFFKGLKFTENEPDIMKRLLSIREYFLPHRAVEELAAWYNYIQSQQAYSNPAAAVSAMYSPVNPLFYPDSMFAAAAANQHALGPLLSAAPLLPGSGTLGLATPGTASPLIIPTATKAGSTPTTGTPIVRVDPSLPPNPRFFSGLPALSENPSILQTHFVTSDGEKTAISKSKDDGGALQSANTNIKSSSPPLVSSGTDNTSSNRSSSTTIQNPNSSHTSAVNNSTNGQTSVAGSAPVKHEKDHDDDLLMNELESLTRAGGITGLNAFRPVSLSPQLFGTTNSLTPIAFATGLTPIMSGTTPLGFMSPMTLNFAPPNPYYGASK